VSKHFEVEGIHRPNLANPAALPPWKFLVFRYTLRKASGADPTMLCLVHKSNFLFSPLFLFFFFLIRVVPPAPSSPVLSAHIFPASLRCCTGGLSSFGPVTGGLNIFGSFQIPSGRVPTQPDNAHPRSSLLSVFSGTAKLISLP